MGQFQSSQGRTYKFLGRFPTDRESSIHYNGNRRFDIMIIKEHSQRLHYGVIADKPGKLFRRLLSQIPNKEFLKCAPVSFFIGPIFLACFQPYQDSCQSMYRIALKVIHLLICSCQS